MNLSFCSACVGANLQGKLRMLWTPRLEAIENVFLSFSQWGGVRKQSGKPLNFSSPQPNYKINQLIPPTSWKLTFSVKHFFSLLDWLIQSFMSGHSRSQCGGNFPWIITPQVTANTRQTDQGSSSLTFHFFPQICFHPLSLSTVQIEGQKGLPETSSCEEDAKKSPKNHLLQELVGFSRQEREVISQDKTPMKTCSISLKCVGDGR